MSTLPYLRVSDNHRFLVTESGDPFFWLGDTAWELFHRLTREEAQFYFATRQRQRFTVIQAVALAEFDGLNTPNVYGEHPLHDNDPARPNEAYFAYVDELIAMAATHELYIGLLPTWGDKVNHRQWGMGPQVFTVENAAVYGRFLGQRYGNQPNVIWILGGDRPAVFENDDYRPLWRAMAAGIDEGAGRRVLKTYHPPGRRSTSAWLHEEEWLDFNTMQSGHGSGRDTAVWDLITHDYNLTPTKPTLDSEPNYEDHPVNPWPQWDPANGHFRDDDVRKQLYRSVFAGGCGVTYGHHSIWQFCGPRNPGINHTDRTWFEAINRPGAEQVKYLRALIESRPFLTRIPDQAVVASDVGTGSHHLQATRDSNGAYLMVYLPTTRAVSVQLTSLTGATLRGWWYSPRTGQLSHIGKVDKATTPATFMPPFDGPDWVLVVEDAAKFSLPPGVIE
ncbi:MAG: glycoside hydrolase family 140 protein [Caldilineaceae bacterium]